MSALTEKVAREHQRQDGAAGDGHSSPRESWTHCSCGADIWAWQQFYAETDEDPDENWTQHIAYVAEAETRAAVAAELAPKVADLIASGIDGATASLDLDLDDADRAVRLADHWRAHSPVDLGRITAALIEEQP